MGREEDVLIALGELQLGRLGEMGTRNCLTPAWIDSLIAQKPKEADPHRLVLVADPQLVDPHTYPGRPALVYGLTVRHTDKYMRRSFAGLLDGLVPDSVFFLGDLFDGGREWSTGSTKSKDKRWRKYDSRLWFKEYDRLAQIFFAPWRQRLAARPSARERKLVASLPGNHDLGFGGGIQLPVRRRFTTFFGPSNRVDVLGNVTFVSLDSVSLSAKQEFEKRENSTDEIWNATQTFLDGAGADKTRVLGRTLRSIYGGEERALQNHTVLELGTLDPAKQWALDKQQVSKENPTVLLTHVPLHRAPGTPCGPLREKWPPSSTSKPLENDERNAISVSFGDQYQNVIAPELSDEIVRKVGNLRYAFSGDDHDYCEVVHNDYLGHTSGVREITVKAFSWAMGVRKPGFLMVSIWNPVDETGASLPPPSTGASADDGPLQSHLCLLPDQLGTFMRYGIMFAATLALLAIRSLLNAAASANPVDPKSPLLPLSTPSTPGSAYGMPDKLDPFSESYTSSTGDGQQSLSVRSHVARPRNAGMLSSIDEKLSTAEARTPTRDGRFLPAQRRHADGRLRRVVLDLGWSLAQVAVVPWLLYLYLS